MRTLANFLYGSTSAEFKSAFDLSESVARLRAATHRSVWGALHAQAAIGPVSPTRVRLQRVIPLVGNSFKPHFIGCFEVRVNGVYLAGRFTLVWAVKVFMTVWFGLVLALGLLPALLSPQHLAMIGPALALAAGGVAVVAFGKWLARNDVAWLSEVIRGALASPDEIAASLLETGSRSSATPELAAQQPPVLKITALVVTILAILCLAGAATGLSSWQVGPAGIVVTHFESAFSRAAAGACALCLLLIAVAIYRGNRWGWRLLLAVILAGPAFSALQLMRQPASPGGTVPRIFFVCGATAVTLYWAFWWWAQRIHFPVEEDHRPSP